MNGSTQSDPDDARESKERLATAFGGFSGGALGWALSYGLFLAVGKGYPVAVVTFALVVLGAFGGMWLARMLGARAFRILGMLSGVIVAGLITLLLFVLMNRARA